MHLSAKGLAAGDGMYHMSPGQLDRYRRAVAAEGSGGELERVIASIESGGIAITGHDALKSAPRGYPAGHPRIRLLRYKGLTSWQGWPPEPWLHTAAAAEQVHGFLRASAGLCSWLAAHAGAGAG